MRSYQNQKVLVLGLGVSGRSMVPFLKQRGAHVQAYDDRSYLENPPCKVLGPNDVFNLNDFDFIATSPGIKKNHPVLIQAQKDAIEVLGEIELAAREISGPCLGITGTNGKSTVTTLVAHLLNVAKIPALALGNIGTPLTSKIEELKGKVAVLELSSFQVEALQTPCLDGALLLNISPDHLDWYASFQEYAASKFLIQRALKANGTFYFEASLKRLWATHFFHPHLLAYKDALLNKNWLPQDRAFIEQKGKLDQLNFAAAVALLEPYKLSEKELIEGLRTFKGLAHRCEYVDTLNQVDFYNDSKATNIESVIKALDSFHTPIHLIMGGQDKGLDFSTLLPYFKNKVKKIYAIGEVQKILQEEFSQAVSVLPCTSLKEATSRAYQQSCMGETILLSPACSSFDMFQNFEHRGTEFKTIVGQIKGEQS